jgi:hypothetical protein
MTIRAETPSRSRPCGIRAARPPPLYNMSFFVNRIITSSSTIGYRLDQSPLWSAREISAGNITVKSPRAPAFGYFIVISMGKRFPRPAAPACIVLGPGRNDVRRARCEHISPYLIHNVAAPQRRVEFARNARSYPPRRLQDGSWRRSSLGWSGAAADSAGTPGR